MKTTVKENDELLQLLIKPFDFIPDLKIRQVDDDCTKPRYCISSREYYNNALNCKFPIDEYHFVITDNAVGYMKYDSTMKEHIFIRTYDDVKSAILCFCKNVCEGIVGANQLAIDECGKDVYSKAILSKAKLVLSNVD